MAFSKSEQKNIEQSIARICDRVPQQIRDQLRIEYTIEGHTVIMEEVRPNRMKQGEFTRMPFAQFRFVHTQSVWQLFWMRSSQKWQSYDPLPTSKSLDELVNAVLEDQVSCFFG